MRRFNQADKVLCLLAVLFCLTLGLKLAYKGNVLIELVFFCSEAALVGGIADWFAVSALFSKPLGFPYHTDLISTNKDKLIAGCGDLVKSFIDRKELLRKAKNQLLLDQVLNFVEQDDNKLRLTSFLLDKAEEELKALDTQSIAENLEGRLLQELYLWDANAYANTQCQRLLEQGKDVALYNYMTTRLLDYVSADERRQQIYDYVDHYIDQKAESTFGGSFFAALGKMFNIINVDDITDKLHGELIRTATELRGNPNAGIAPATGGAYAPNLLTAGRSLESLYASSEEPRAKIWFLSQFRASLQTLLQSASFQALITDLHKQTVDQLQLQQPIKLILDQLIQQACRPAAAREEGLVKPTLLSEIITNGVECALVNLKAAGPMREQAEALLQDVAKRVTMKGHTWLVPMVTEIMGGIDDRRLNEIIYDKVEQDMVWIRLNGSIVGAALGFVLFWIVR